MAELRSSDVTAAALVGVAVAAALFLGGRRPQPPPQLPPTGPPGGPPTQPPPSPAPPAQPGFCPFSELVVAPTDPLGLFGVRYFVITGGTPWPNGTGCVARAVPGDFFVVCSIDLSQYPPVRRVPIAFIQAFHQGPPIPYCDAGVINALLRLA